MYWGNDGNNFYLDKQVYFEADDNDQLPTNGIDFQANLEYRNYVNNHLNQSFAISYPFGRFVSYVNAFLDKYVELKN